MAGRPVSTIKDKDGNTVGHYGDFAVVPINDPIDNPCEPPMRIDWTNPKSKRKLTALANLIKEQTLKEPIAITKDGLILDGHRRRTVCRDLLGWTKIPAYIVPDKGTFDSTDDFVMMNSSKLAIDGNQYLWMYMDGHNIPANHLARIEQLIKWCGKTRALHLFDRIIKNNGSAATYAYAMGIYRKELKKYPKFKKKLLKGHMNDLVHWMLNTGNPSDVKYAIYNYIPLETLVEAIDSKSRLDPEWKVKNPKTKR